MKILAIAAFAAGLMVSSAASAGVVFYEGFDGYDLSGLARGATGENVVTSSTAPNNTISTSYGFRTGTSGNGYGDLNSMYDEGTWTIGTNPNTTHNLWKTVTGTNNMLILNGKTGATEANPALAWASNVFAVSGGTYKLSFDLMNVCCEAPSNAYSTSTLWIEYQKPGDSAFTRIVVPLDTINGAGVFFPQAENFTVGAGNIRVALYDSQGDANGNDFGVDNITVASVPEPASWALMMLGFGGLGAALRGQRRRRLVAA